MSRIMSGPQLWLRPDSNDECDFCGLRILLGQLYDTSQRGHTTNPAKIRYEHAECRASINMQGPNVSWYPGVTVLQPEGVTSKCQHCACDINHGQRLRIEFGKAAHATCSGGWTKYWLPPERSRARVMEMIFRVPADADFWCRQMPEHTAEITFLSTVRPSLTEKIEDFKRGRLDDLAFESRSMVIALAAMIWREMERSKAEDKVLPCTNCGCASTDHDQPPQYTDWNRGCKNCTKSICHGGYGTEPGGTSKVTCNGRGGCKPWCESVNHARHRHPPEDKLPPAVGPTTRPICPRPLGSEVHPIDVADAFFASPVLGLQLIDAGLGGLLRPVKPSDKAVYAMHPKLRAAWLEFHGGVEPASTLIDVDIPWVDWLRRTRHKLVDQPWWHRGTLPDLGED